MARLKYIPGTRFGRLVIVLRAGTQITCHCDCGNGSVVHLSNLISGHTSSCGCLRVETTAARSLKHGSARRRRKTPTYLIWEGMLKRCLNPRYRDWANYGGRGITVCDQWRSFEAFLADMGERPPSHSIDRKDVNGPYCKENCTWATRQEQNRNTRRNHLITHDRKTQTLAAWAAELGLHHVTILRRLRRGLSIDLAPR